MGHGSSARPYSQGGSAVEVITLERSALEANTSRRQQDRRDEEARWLRNVIEKEKAEKEWLMARFERAETELIARSEEAASLRLQLNAMTSSASGMNGSALDVTAAAMGSPSSASPGGSSPSSPGLSLKDRRGLRLMVDTNSSRVTPKLAENVASPVEAQKAPPPQPPSRSEAFLAELTQKEQGGPLVEPMTAKATVGSRGSWLEEPMSPLLKRRIAAKGGVSSDFVEGGRRRPAAKLDRDKFMTSPAGVGTPTGSGLSVSTPKIFKMEDCPQTPKRVPASPKTARLRQQTMWDTSTIVETDEQINSP